MDLLNFSDKWNWIMYFIPSIINIIFTILIFFVYIRNTNYANMKPTDSVYYDWSEWSLAAWFFLILSIIPIINLTILFFYIISIFSAIFSLIFFNNK